MIGGAGCCFPAGSTFSAAICPGFRARFHIPDQELFVIKQRKPSCTFVETLEPRRLLAAILDLRLTGGGNSVVVNSVGQIINLDIIVTITGNNTSTTDEGFQSGGGNLLSTNVSGGAALGTLKATVASPFDATGSQNGKQQDLDADTDIDVGTGDDTANPNDPFTARAGNAQ